MNYRRFCVYVGFLCLVFISNEILFLIISSLLIVTNEIFIRIDKKIRYKKIMDLIEKGQEDNFSILDDEVKHRKENRELLDEVKELIRKLKIREHKILYREEYIKNLYEVFDGALITVSENGKIISANDNFYEMANVDKDRNENLYVNQIEMLNKIYETMNERGKTEGELVVESKMYRYRCRTLTGNLKDRIVYIRDITAEFKMMSLIGETQSIIAVKDFASGVAHEIRNPLTPIKGFLQIIKNGLSHENEKTRKYMDVIFREIERINSKIENLHRFANKKDVEANLEDIKEIIDIAIEKTKIDIEAEQKEITIITDYNHMDRKIEIPRDLVKEAVQNILSNSINAIGKTGEIKIQTKDSKNDLIITIADNGSGIEEKKLKRLNNGEMKMGEKSIKLGLIVSQNNIKELGGKLEIESELGEGTIVKIKLPIQL